MSFRVPTITIALLSTAAALAQTPDMAPPPGAPPPPVTHLGLVPGVSTIEQVREKLGPPLHEASWYSWKMLYPARGRAGHLDAIHLQGKKVVGDIEAATIPEGLETLDAVIRKVGEPEFTLEFSRQTIVDYSALGARFVFNAAGRTIGVAYFPHGFPRVHAGERRRLSLRGLRQGPQPGPAAGLGTRSGSKVVAEDAPPLRCGAAQADITPLEPDWLGPVAFTVHDPLRARALILAQGDLEVAIVGGDIFGMQQLDVEPIEARLREIGVDHLILAMSHVHSAGDPIGIYGHYPAKFVKRIQDGVVEAVRKARESLRPVGDVRVSSDELPLDGARVEGLFRNARNPGILDPQIAAVQVLGLDGKPIVTIAHFACHPESVLHPDDKSIEVTADFPGYLCDALGASTGGQAVFLNGAVGGMVSGDTRARTHEETAAMGKRLAAEIERILGFAVSTPARLSVERRRIEIPVTNPKMLAFEERSGRKSFYRGRCLAEIHRVRIGDAEMLTVPGELLPEVSFEILEAMRGYPRMIVGLVNNEIGYIIPPYDFRAGEYEESMSLGPAAGPVVLRQALSLLRE